MEEGGVVKVVKITDPDDGESNIHIFENEEQFKDFQAHSKDHGYEYNFEDFGSLEIVIHPGTQFVLGNRVVNVLVNVEDNILNVN